MRRRWAVSMKKWLALYVGHTGPKLKSLPRLSKGLRAYRVFPHTVYAHPFTEKFRPPLRVTHARLN